MSGNENYIHALEGKKIPLLVLDQKWHRLFAVHGKTDEIKEQENELNNLLIRQGKLNSELKEYKRLKNKLMSGIVENMDDGIDNSVRDQKLEENKRLIDELNDKMDACEEELAAIPGQLNDCNRDLMLLSMDYFYNKLRVNQEEAQEIADWITQVRIDLKKNIIRKQNREINNREIYAYLHDIFGPEVIDIFDIAYEHKKEEDDQTDSNDESKKE